jgi:hypothetical protein
MNFRQCVIDCIAEGEVVQSFNRLHDRPITPDLLGLLSATGEDQLCLGELHENDQELLACFILFVHRHVWRKMKFAESRVTRVREDFTAGVGVTVAQFVKAVAIGGGGREDYVQCDG